MARGKTFGIKVNEQEWETLEALANLEKLPVGTFVRRFMMLEAERRGLLPSRDDKARKAESIAKIDKFFEESKL